MKFFAIIMSLYLLTLSCIPCSEACNTDSALKISACSNQKSHKHNDEACTPFCTCSCCAASAYYQPLVKPQLLKPVIQIKKYPVCNVSFLSHEFSAIWQPPKLS